MKKTCHVNRFNQALVINIKFANHLKYLWVTTDSKLKWNELMNDIAIIYTSCRRICDVYIQFITLLDIYYATW